jgi:threonine-phosphate decarboxylase
MRDDLPRRMEHGGRIRWHQTHGKGELLDFSANINPYPPRIPWTPDPSMLADYPDDRYETLKDVIGRTFGRGADEITVGNGSVELIRAFCVAVLECGDSVFIEQPTFAEYEMAARLAGAACTDNLRYAKVRFLCNPNNPTGTLNTKQDVLALSRQAADLNMLFFLDEAFIELADPTESLVGVPRDNLFVLRSLTKSFAVPGRGGGYAFGVPEVIEKVETVRLPWTVNAFAESFAIEAFMHYDELEQSRNSIRRERDWLCDQLARLELTYERPSANFILVSVPMEAEILVQRLLHHAILVRDCRSFGLPRHIRIAVRTREENQTFIEALEACLH